MQDVKVKQENNVFDIVIKNNEIQGVDSLETAYLVQLFTNKREDGVKIVNPLDRGGFIGDIVTKSSGYEMGSSLFTKAQSRDTPQNRLEVVELAMESVGYFVKINAAQSVTAEATQSGVSGEIVVSADRTITYSEFWRQIKHG